MTDHEIIDLFFERQETAIDMVKKKYGLRMFKTAQNIINNQADAEECVNDALLKVWNAIPPERPMLLGAFAAKIARNLALNIYKAQRTQKRGGDEMDLILGELQDSIPDQTNIHEIMAADDVVKTIDRFLYSLEQETRMAFVLRYFHSEPIATISERLHLSESDVKSKLFRVRKKLAAHLEEEGIVL